MTYYIGFRFGWVSIGKRTIAWQDATYYPYMPGRTVWKSWKVWAK